MKEEIKTVLGSLVSCTRRPAHPTLPKETLVDPPLKLLSLRHDITLHVVWLTRYATMTLNIGNIRLPYNTTSVWEEVIAFPDPYRKCSYCNSVTQILSCNSKYSGIVVFLILNVYFTMIG